MVVIRGYIIKYSKHHYMSQYFNGQTILTTQSCFDKNNCIHFWIVPITLQKLKHLFEFQATKLWIIWLFIFLSLKWSHVGNNTEDILYKTSFLGVKTVYFPKLRPSSDMVIIRTGIDMPWMVLKYTLKIEDVVFSNIKLQVSWI